MQYVPKLKSVDDGGSATKLEANFLTGRRSRWGWLIRLTAFFAALFCVLCAAFVFNGMAAASVVSLACALASATTLFAALFLAGCRPLELIKGRDNYLSPREYEDAFALLSALMDTMPANFLVKDKQRRYILINKTMGDWFGWDPGEVIGKTFDDVSWSRDFPRENDKIREHDEVVLTTGKMTERFFEAQKADGSWIKVLSKRFPVRSRHGDIIGVAITNVDVTDLEQTRTESQEIRRERDRQATIFKGFFEALPFPAGMKGTDGRFINVNSQLLKWNTFPTQDVIGKRLEEMVGQELARDSMALDEQVLTTRETASMERTFTFYDGVQRTMKILRFPLLNDDGVLFGLGLFNIDVTEQRAAERLLQDTNQALENTVDERTAALQSANLELKKALAELQAATDLLIESDRMASLGSMVAGMAHEINTPIGVGVTAASLVRDKVDQLKDDILSGRLTRDGMTASMNIIDEASDVMLRNMARADSLIRSLKQVAADQTNLDTRDVNLGRYLREVELSVAPVLTKAGITVEWDCHPGLVANLQPGPLAQVMTNLLMNIVHHAYPDGMGGRARIETELIPGWVSVRVRDYGVGMDEETVVRIFVPFFTTRRNKGGTGLGLSIVYNVVRSVLGGEIAVESNPGEGTVFTLNLPISRLAGQTE